MKLLLDIHLLLRAAGWPERLPGMARAMLDSDEHTPMFSPVSLWEVAIKRGLGRPDFRLDPGLLRRGLVDNGWLELPIDGRHAVTVAGLEPIHEDSFDRILVAQALVEGILLLTSDHVVGRYMGPIRVV